MQVLKNRVRTRLQAGETVYFSSVRLPDPGLCEILGCAGFDGIWLDGEHGAATGASLEHLIRGCLTGQTAPFARMGSAHDVAAIMRALDLGAQGIVLPHCASAEEVAAFRAAALYPPEGRRGVGPGRGSRWGRVTGEEYFAETNRQTVLIGIIEDAAALERIDEIAAGRLDILWLGSGDLAADLGLLGQPEHPQVQDAARVILKACQRHSVTAGLGVPHAGAAQQALEQGYGAVALGGGAEQYVLQAGRAFLEPLGR